MKNHLRQKPAWHWANDFRLHQLDDQSVRMAIRTDQPEIVKFGRSRQTQLIELLHQIANRPLRVEIDIQLTADEDRHASSDDDGSPTPTGADRSSPPIYRAAPSAASASIRAQAMQDPAVRQVMDLFNASIIALFPQGQDPEELAAKAAAQAMAAKMDAAADSAGDQANLMAIVKPPSGPAIHEADLTEEEEDV